jgi:glycogen synthase
MNIVFVSRELGLFRGTGGIGTYVWDIARHLAAQGHRCTVVCAGDTTTEPDRVVEGVRVIALRAAQLDQRSKFVDRFRFRERFFAYRSQVADVLDRLIASERVDVVEFAEFGAESIVWQRRRRSVPMVIRWHTPVGRQFSLRELARYPIRRWTDARTLEAVRSADAITFPSRWMAERVASSRTFENLCWCVIPNGINAGDWAGSQTLTASHDGPTRILYVGTLHARKGFVQLIDAVKALRDQNVAVTLTLVGKHTRFSKRVEERHRPSMEAGWLRIVGEVAREALPGHYAAADLCCFPAMFENAPIVCLEAMAAGRIVIGSANSGMAEVIRHGVDGFLMNPGDVRALSNAIREVIGLPKERKAAIASEARARMQRTFDNSVVSARLLEFYGEVGDRYRRTRSERSLAGAQTS